MIQTFLKTLWLKVCPQCKRLQDEVNRSYLAQWDEVNRYQELEILYNEKCNEFDKLYSEFEKIAEYTEMFRHFEHFSVDDQARIV